MSICLPALRLGWPCPSPLKRVTRQLAAGFHIHSADPLARCSPLNPPRTYFLGTSWHENLHHRNFEETSRRFDTEVGKHGPAAPPQVPSRFPNASFWGDPRLRRESLFLELALQGLSFALQIGPIKDTVLDRTHPLRGVVDGLAQVLRLI